MKQYIIYTLFLIACSVNLVAQDYIELDGKKIPKEKLNPYSGLGYEVDLTKPENKPTLKSAGIGKNMKITSQRVFASKGMKSFAQATVYEDSDSVKSHFHSSILKKIDGNGKKIWEKEFSGSIPRSCFLSQDGKYTTIDFENCKLSEEGDLKNALSIFDEKGNTVCEYPFPVKFSISNNRDLVCYQEEVLSTRNFERNKTFYCVDLKTEMQWIKIFEKDVEVRPVSQNGDFIIAYSDSAYSLYSREGKIIFKKPVKEFGGGINEISNDGRYALIINSSTKFLSYFDVIELVNMKKYRIKYLDLEHATHKIFNGGCFVTNSKYILALTSIIAPMTAMIIFHDMEGNCLGHKVYHDIKSSFWYPRIYLENDGSFEVYMDGDYLGNLVLPNTNTSKYFNE